jgi:hypothetical protein
MSTIACKAASPPAPQAGSITESKEGSWIVQTEAGTEPFRI